MIDSRIAAHRFEDAIASRGAVANSCVTLTGTGKREDCELRQYFASDRTEIDPARGADLRFAK